MKMRKNNFSLSQFSLCIMKLRYRNILIFAYFKKHHIPDLEIVTSLYFKTINLSLKRKEGRILHDILMYENRGPSEVMEFNHQHQVL